jgi:hypothetical protein
LQEAVGQILAEYALRQPATQVRAIFGASNELADHLVAGAPGDVFISAEPAELDRLSTFGLILPRSRRTFARNGLAFVGRPTMKVVTSMRELGTAKFRRIAVAEPTCPLGNHSRSFFEQPAFTNQFAVRRCSWTIRAQCLPPLFREPPTWDLRFRATQVARAVGKRCSTFPHRALVLRTKLLSSDEVKMFRQNFLWNS